MSGPVAVVNDVEGALSLPDRTKSLDPVVFNDRIRFNELNGDVNVSLASHGSSGFKEGRILLPNGDSYSGSLLGNYAEGSGSYIWPDGCRYEGEWQSGMRHGYGKLQWPSGAWYEGEFSGGYMHGNGTYSRPGNMTYRGRWRLSLKHGLGHQNFVNGDVFEGSWIQGSPEGPGKYTWANGNVYMGNMKAGKMSGKGTLNWVNGDSFEGSWLNGMMHGFGVYTWVDGGCYVGTWTRGLKDGKGTFYPKGNKLPSGQEFYLNALRKQGLLPDPRRKNQMFHMDHASSVDLGYVRVGQNGSGQSSSGESKGSMVNLEGSRPEKVSLERRWSLDPSMEKVMGHDKLLRSMSDTMSEGVDNNVNDVDGPILEREYMQGVLISELVLSNRFSPSSRRARRRQKKLAREIKKPGEQIIKGHRSYDLMLCLQLGIRYTVGKITPVPTREVRATDFSPRASFWVTFPKEGSQLTPTHHSDDFKWKDYCPMVFRFFIDIPSFSFTVGLVIPLRNLREMFKIDAADYMMSICGNDALRELSSPGKSGSVFFLSQDGRFMIKTLRKSEIKVLLQMLPDYHRHVHLHDNTLITKFFGLHRIKPTSGQKFRFVVMGNMFCTELRIHRRFDLKGSSLGRSADKVEIDENTILKDLDLDYCFYLEPSWRDALMEQIETDNKFLESQRIMDYSLLLGVHYRAPSHLRSLISYSRCMSVDGLGIVAENGKSCAAAEAIEEEISPRGLVLVPRGADDDSVIVGSHIRGSRLKQASLTGDEEVDLLLPGTARLQIQLGVNMPARAELIPGKEKSEMFHEVYDVVLYLGIIDILQEYNMSKKIEHACKSMQFDSVSISAVDPKFYSNRFLEFIKKVFPENPAVR